MSIEQIIEGYAQEPQLVEFAERLKSDPALLEKTQEFATVVAWYFARAAGLSVDQALAAFDTMGLGRKPYVD